jgi:DNA-binding NarL/FixJ family response regulator
MLSGNEGDWMALRGWCTLITVLLVEDHILLRSATKALLATEPHLALVGEATTIQQVFDLVRQFRPDIVILKQRLGFVKI